MTDVVACVASEGVSVGFAHCVPTVPAQPCRMVTAMIAASVSNERLIFLINRFTGERRGKARKTSALFETGAYTVRYLFVTCGFLAVETENLRSRFLLGRALEAERGPNLFDIWSKAGLQIAVFAGYGPFI